MLIIFFQINVRETVQIDIGSAPATAKSNPDLHLVIDFNEIAFSLQPCSNYLFWVVLNFFRQELAGRCDHLESLAQHWIKWLLFAPLSEINCTIQSNYQIC